MAISNGPYHPGGTKAFRLGAFAGRGALTEGFRVSGIGTGGSLGATLESPLGGTGSLLVAGLAGGSEITSACSGEFDF